MNRIVRRLTSSFALGLLAIALVESGWLKKGIDMSLSFGKTTPMAKPDPVFSTDPMDVALTPVAAALLAELLMSKEWADASDVFGEDIIDHEFRPSEVYNGLLMVASRGGYYFGEQRWTRDELREMWMKVRNSESTPVSETHDALFAALYEVAYEHGYEDGRDDR